MGCTGYFEDAGGYGYGVEESLCLGATNATDNVSQTGDCYDKSADVHPGVIGWFTADRGDGSFDYDCDGASVQQYTQVGGHCDTTLGFCSGKQSAFVGDTIPACGSFGQFVEGCDSGFFSCDEGIHNIQQVCH